MPLFCSWRVQVPYTKPKNLGVFAKPIWPYRYVLIYIPSLKPAVYLPSVSPPSPCFLAFFYISFRLCLVPPKLIYEQLLSLVSSYIFPCFFDYAIPPGSPFTFSPTASSAMAGNLLFGTLFTLYCIFIFFTSLFLRSGCIPSSALNTAVPVLHEHPVVSILLWFSLNCCHVYFFPALLRISRPLSHTFLAYSSFGTITFVRAHL